jgi:AcrR family transcriptional regulator
MQAQELSERQMQLVAVAMRILASEGPRRFTAQRLAEDVGLTPGAIYNHFDSMEAIVDAVVDHMGASLFEGFPPKANDPITRLELFFRRRARDILANPHISRLLLTDYLAQAAGASRADRVEDFKRRTQQFVIGCLREAAEKGLLALDVSPAAGAIIVVGAVLSLSHAGTPIADASKLEHLFDEIWQAIERMLRRAPRARRSCNRRASDMAEVTRTR